MRLKEQERLRRYVAAAHSAFVNGSLCPDKEVIHQVMAQFGKSYEEVYADGQFEESFEYDKLKEMGRD